MSALIVFATTPNEKIAKNIAEELLNARLAACVSIQGPVLSLFHWEDEVKEESEILLIIKTNEKTFIKLEALNKAHHPYDLPEIIASSITHANSAYLEWIDKTLTKENRCNL